MIDAHPELLVASALGVYGLAFLIVFVWSWRAQRDRGFGRWRPAASNGLFGGVMAGSLYLGATVADDLNVLGL